MRWAKLLRLEIMSAFKLPTLHLFPYLSSCALCLSKALKKKLHALPLTSPETSRATRGYSISLPFLTLLLYHPRTVNLVLQKYTAMLDILVLNAAEF